MFAVCCCCVYDKIYPLLVLTLEESYLFVRYFFHLFTKTENNEEDVDVKKKAQSAGKDERDAKGPRAHSSPFSYANLFPLGTNSPSDKVRNPMKDSNESSRRSSFQLSRIVHVVPATYDRENPIENNQNDFVPSNRSHFKLSSTKLYRRQKQKFDRKDE